MEKPNTAAKPAPRQDSVLVRAIKGLWNALFSDPNSLAARGKRSRWLPSHELLKKEESLQAKKKTSRTKARAARKARKAVIWARSGKGPHGKSLGRRPGR